MNENVSDLTASIRRDRRKVRYLLVYMALIRLGIVPPVLLATCFVLKRGSMLTLHGGVVIGVATVYLAVTVGQFFIYGVIATATLFKNSSKKQLPWHAVLWTLLVWYATTTAVTKLTILNWPGSDWPYFMGVAILLAGLEIGLRRTRSWLEIYQKQLDLEVDVVASQARREQDRVENAAIRLRDDEYSRTTAAIERLYGRNIVASQYAMTAHAALRRIDISPESELGVTSQIAALRALRLQVEQGEHLG